MEFKKYLEVPLYKQLHGLVGQRSLSGYLEKGIGLDVEPKSFHVTYHVDI